MSPFAPGRIARILEAECAVIVVIGILVNALKSINAEVHPRPSPPVGIDTDGKGVITNIVFGLNWQRDRPYGGAAWAVETARRLGNVEADDVGLADGIPGSIAH